jgi:hypothetical protein
MNQEIGITLKVHGVSAVEASFLRIDSLIDGLSSKLAGLGRHGNVLDKFTTSLSGLGKSGTEVTALARGIDKTTTSLEKGAATLDRYTESLKRYGQVAASLPAPNLGKGAGSGYAPTQAPGVGPGGDRMDRRAAAQTGHLPLQFLGTYWGAGAAYNTTKSGIENIGLGYSREKLLKPHENLMAVNMDANQRRQSEEWARGFARKVYAGGNTTEKSLDALSEVLSAAGPDDKKWRSMQDAQKATEAGLMYGIVSQQGSSQALKQLMSATHAQYFALPDNERLKYETGAKSFGGLIEQTGAKLAKIVQISSTWGPDTARFLQYGLVSALDKGMNLDQILAIAGTTKTAGIPGQKAGRGLKTILEGEIGKFAALSFAGDEDPTAWTKYQGLDQKQREALRSKRQFELVDQIRENPFGFLDNLNKWLHTAESRKIDIMRSGINLSKDWVNYERLLVRPGTVEASRAAEKELAGTNDMRDVRRRIQSMQEGEKGYSHHRLSNAIDAVTQSWAANTPGKGVVDVLSQGLYRMSDLGKDGKGINPFDLEKEMQKVQQDVALSLIQSMGFMKGGDKRIRIDDLDKALYDVPSVINEAIGSWTGKLRGFVDHVKGNIGRDWNNLKEGVGNLFTPKHPYGDSSQIPGGADTSGVEGTERLPRGGSVPQGGSDLELQGAAAQVLALASGGQAQGQGSAPNIRVFIGDREIRDIVVEAMDERRMENRNKWANSW